MPHPDSRTQTRIVKDIVDTIFFTIRGLCREAAQTSADPMGQAHSGIFPRLYQRKFCPRPREGADRNNEKIE